MQRKDEEEEGAKRRGRGARELILTSIKTRKKPLQASNHAAYRDFPLFLVATSELVNFKG